MIGMVHAGSQQVLLLEVVPSGGESLQESLLIKQHHGLEELILLHDCRDGNEGAVSLEVNALQLFPAEAFSHGELVAEPESLVGVAAFQLGLVVVHQEERRVDVFLSYAAGTS